MDLWERLSDSIDSIQGLPMPCSMGFLDGEDTLCVYSMPGSRTVEEYFDGTKEREMLYEVGFNTKDQEKAKPHRQGKDLTGPFRRAFNSSIRGWEFRLFRYRNKRDTFCKRTGHSRELNLFIRYQNHHSSIQKLGGNLNGRK